MSTARPITVIGGGLAGLALGIGLRRAGIPVTVWEAGHYPRHRVCGEFISGRGQDVLDRLGLRASFLEAEANLAHTGAFFAGRGSSPVRRLPAPALCLSRFTMDALLAERFRECGGELRENARWGDSGSEEGVVHASGRRLQPRGPGARWFGLKVHARNVPLMADLEMHCVPNGYVGLCRLNAEEVNVCGLFRGTARSRETAATWREALRGAPSTALHQRLVGALFDETTFCSVAGLSLKPQGARARPECCIGDALTMIPPVTGNGMSMALEAAEMAIEPLAAYSRGELAWSQAQQATASACDDAFHQRLAWARWLQWMMLTPVLRGWPGDLLLRSNWLWHAMFSRTR